MIAGPGLPCGARKLDDRVLGRARPGTVWVDLCMLGQHLPQMYRRDEIRVLEAGGCARLGLCPDCLGFGDLGPPAAAALQAARDINQVRPCPKCAGSGRPAIRVTVARDPSGVQGSIRPLPHEYVPPLPDADPDLAALFGVPPDMCLACGCAQAGTGPRGEALHPVQAEGEV